MNSRIPGSLVIPFGLSLVIMLAAIACTSEPAAAPAAVPTAVPTFAISSPTALPVTSAPSPLAAPTARAVSIAPTATATAEHIKPEPITIPEDAPVKLEEYINANVDLDYFSGSVLVAQGDDILISKGYGLANHDQDIANIPSTKYNIGALTYQFTAMAIMQLQEQGLLLVDDKVSKYLPDFPNGELMTIHNLLTFGSGLTEYTRPWLSYQQRNLNTYTSSLRPSFELVMESPTSVEELIGLFRDEPLEFDPGQRFTGDNSGYILLGAIIEQVSGISYGDYVQKRIFEPLGMADSGYNLSIVPMTGKAVNYIFTGDDPVVADPIDMSNGFSAFGLYSTVQDLHRWDRALYTEQLLGKGGLDDLLTVHRSYTAYGWLIHTLHGRNATSWNGFCCGYHTGISRLVDDDIVIIVLSNSSLSSFTQMTSDIAAILVGLPYTIPEERTAIELDADKLDDFVGEYDFIEVTREGDDLFMTIGDLPSFQIFPGSRTRFFSKIADFEINFTKTDLAGVIGAVIRIDGNNVIDNPAMLNVRKTLIKR